MKKNFKNKLAVGGSLTLKKAFVEELESLGYERNKRSNELDENYIQVNQYGGPGFYSFHSNTIHDEGDVFTLHLPEDWNRALVLAAVFEVEKLKPEVGKWYKLTHHPKSIIYCTSINGKGSLYGFGFDMNGNWYNNSNQNFSYCLCNGVAFEGAILATVEEVSKSLGKEAIKRYPIGCIIDQKKAYNNFSTGKHKITSHNFYVEFEHSHCNVSLDNKGVFNAEYGEWAEIVPSEVKINGLLVTRIDKDTIKVGCRKINVYQLLSLKELLDTYGGYYTLHSTIWKTKEVNDLLKAADDLLYT